jgi:hypothetical protein
VQDEQSDAVLARLRDQNSALWYDTFMRRAGLSKTELDHIEAKAKKRAEEWAKRIHETDPIRWQKQKETRQRMYRLGRRFLTVAGGVLFVWLALALSSAWP